MPKVAILLAFFVVSIIFVLSVHADANLLINEFLPRPSSGNPEWVEFYNMSSSSIDLSDYFFDDDSNFDSDSGSSAKVALSGILSASQSCYWELSSYLNNNGDSPSLFKIGESVAVDTFTYTESQTDFSFARVPDGGQWQSNQSPTKFQTSCLSLAPSPSPILSLTIQQSTSSTSSKSKSPSPSPKNPSSPTYSKKTTSVLGSSQSAEVTRSPVSEISLSVSPTPQAETETQQSSNKLKIAGTIAGSGAIIMGVSVGLYLWYRKKLITSGQDEEQT